VKEIYKIV